ncbi:prophage tail gpP-like protein [Arthrobacter sp. AZCC_0090]|nr:prophage tail gpP-like protein [Arthrobacter sp. AZCC_0090]
MDLHLQPDWQRALGQYVEIRLGGKTVRTGTVDSVMPDSSILWISAQGTDTRMMVEQARGNEVFVGYQWAHADPWPR